MIILPANTLSTGGYEVANSVRFEDDDSATLSLTHSAGASSEQITWTLSFWIKRADLQFDGIFAADNNNFNSNFAVIDFDSNHKLNFYNYTSSKDFELTTNRVFRDVSAWYHIVVAYDSSQGSASNRVKIYVNGTQETSFATANYPSSDFETRINKSDAAHSWGGRGGGYGSFYLSEAVMVTGSQLTPTSFGEFDEDSPQIWKPKDVSGLTFGTNGFYLDFEDSSALGNDVSGNNNDFTANNLAATDSSTDTCTLNYATWNSLISSNGSTSEGNVKYVTGNSSSNYGYRLSTIGVSSGMWYAEVKYTSSSNQAAIGIRSRNATSAAHQVGYYNDDYAIYVDGHYYNNNSETTNSNASWTSGDIIGIYLDLDNNKLYFSKNGSLYSSTGISITAAASTTTGFYFFSATEWNSSGDGTFELNTGGSPSFSITSSNTDGKYGNFEYSTTITGDGASKTFKALNTKNLAEYG